MSGAISKEILARNLRYYVERSGKTQRELAGVVGVAPSTFNDWVQGNKYPRMDKVEILVDYFGIRTSDLVEEKLTPEKEEDNNVLADIIVRMRMDVDFFNTVEALQSLDAEQLKSVQDMLKAFTK